MNADLLEHVPVVPLRMELWWRHCFLPRNPDDQDPLFVKATTKSRWQTADGTLYLGDRASTVWCEYLRNSAGQVERADPSGGLRLTVADVRALATEQLDVVPRGLWRVEVSFDRVADLVSTPGLDALDAAGISPDDLIADDFGPCPDIAAEHPRFGWQAVIAPSAALTAGQCVAVFPPFYPRRALWRREYRAAQPAVVHAHLTRFRAGERPSWLPPSP